MGHYITKEDRDDLFSSLEACPQLETLSVVPRRNHLWPWTGRHTHPSLRTLILWPKSMAIASLHLKPMTLRHRFGFSTLIIRIDGDAWSRSAEADQEGQALRLEVESWRVPDVLILVELWKGRSTPRPQFPH